MYFIHNTDVVIGVIVQLFLVLLGMIIDHILEFSVLIVESSQILVNSLMMDQPIHQIIRILWQFIHFQYDSHHFLYRKGKVSLIQVSLYVLNQIIHYLVRCICLTLLLLVKTLVKRARCRINIALEMLLGLLLWSYFGNIAAAAASRRWVHIFECYIYPKEEEKLCKMMLKMHKDLIFDQFLTSLTMLPSQANTSHVDMSLLINFLY